MEKATEVKIAFRLAVFCLLMLISTYKGYAQRSLILDNFSVTEYYGKVYLNWTISSGSTCNGIQVYRSVDKISYSTIGDIPGVCGNNSFAQAYSFIDANPIKNGFSYYFIQLGGNGNSEVLQIQVIDVTANGYQVRPNPVIDESKIYFSNRKSGSFQLALYNPFGVQIKTFSTTNDYFEIDASELPNGIYLFLISGEGLIDKTKGRLIVAH